MRIAIASDHAGFLQKAPLISFIRDLGHEIVDLGPTSDERCDYPDFADLVAREVSSRRADRGILICGTGLGMAICANKVAGVRAVSINSPIFARLSRQHNDANVLCLSGRYVSLMDNCELIRIFLETDFEAGRHCGRVEKIMREDDPDFKGISH